MPTSYWMKIDVEKLDKILKDLSMNEGLPYHKLLYRLWSSTQAYYYIKKVWSITPAMLYKFRKKIKNINDILLEK